MKTIILILISLIITSCATSCKNDTIKLPVVLNKKEVSGLEKAVKTKYKIGERGSNVFDFYYGPRGAYYIIVTSKSGDLIDLSNYDITLQVNSNDNDSPEILSMAIEDKQVLSGFGEVREGKTKFKLIFNAVDTSISRSFDFDFSLNINYFL